MEALLTVTPTTYMGSSTAQTYTESLLNDRSGQPMSGPHPDSSDLTPK